MFFTMAFKTEQADGLQEAGLSQQGHSDTAEAPPGPL